jgi:glycosyltransferase involved in cell wall biosynthesis
MRPWHGLDVLLRAISMTNLSLMLIGDGPDRARIERVCQQLGLAHRVCFTGRVPQTSMPEHLAAVDIGVVADDQTQYASPMKLLEYMSMSKPVVAPDLPNIRDIVTDHDEGLLFEPGSAESLAERLTTLEDGALRARLGARGRLRVEADRNWISNAQRVLGAIAAQ